MRGVNGSSIETFETSPPTPHRPWVAIGVSLTIHAALIATTISVRPSAALRQTSVRSGAAAIELQASRPPAREPSSTRFETEPDSPSSWTAADDSDESVATHDDVPPEPQPESESRDRRRRKPDAQASATTRPVPPPPPSPPRASASEPRRVPRDASSAALPEIRHPPLRPASRRKPIRPPKPESATVASVPVPANSVPVPANSVPVPANSTPGAQQQTPRPLASNRPPNYPAEAIADRLEGTTTLRATVGPGGQVTRLEIARSSGSAVLDRAAMSAVALWRFEPETESVRERVPRRVLIPIRFRLDD